MQMCWIKGQIQQQVARIQCQGNPMVALARFSYDLVAQQIDRVVNADFGSGYLVLVGGITINMPRPCVDHFLPLRFEVRRGDSVQDLRKMLEV